MNGMVTMKRIHFWLLLIFCMSLTAWNFYRTGKSAADRWYAQHHRQPIFECDYGGEEERKAASKYGDLRALRTMLDVVNAKPGDFGWFNGDTPGQICAILGPVHVITRIDDASCHAQDWAASGGKATVEIKKP